MPEFALSIAEKVLVKLGLLVHQDICLAWGIKNELQKLGSSLTIIKAVLLDAEEKQATNLELSIWLGRLKDTLYDVEDVLDEIEVEALRRRAVSNQAKVCNLFSESNPLAFCLKMSCKIKKIRESLDDIAAHKSKFPLSERLEDRPLVHKERKLSHSLVRVSDIIGRDNDKENIIKHLLCLDDGVDNVSIIPIVGIGGLGKSTLANLVYFDEQVVRHFERMMRVSVPDDYLDVTKVVKSLITFTTGEYCDDLNTNQLQTRLRIILSGRRFLVILDGVRNIEPVKWSELKQLLAGGARGSKIIVTTRSPSVASLMGTVPSYNLPGLSHNDCLSLFIKCAFKEGDQGEKHSNLLKIGEDIVKKCGGVPLALRSIGGLLYSKTNENDWLFVRDNEIWDLEQKENDILPALKLSFGQMPSCLIPCLTFISMFPIGTVFARSSLILFLMAHELILPSNENKEMEDVGEQYLKELVFRSFIYVVEYQTHSYSIAMPDLIHDLALSMAQSEYLTMNSMTQNVSENVRHLSFATYSGADILGQQVPVSLKKLKSVRTLLLPPLTEKATLASKPYIDMCISKFKYMRSLNLVGSSFEVLPSSIGNLKHLRNLVLVGNMRIKELPKSLCRLQSLQTLNLDSCVRLKRLPYKIGSMISLRFLVVTTQESQLPENELACLSSLRHLQFYLCRNLIHLFEGMQRLKALRTLVIQNCPYLISLPSGIKHLMALETLVIVDCPSLNLNLRMEREAEDSHQDGSGLSSLRALVIQGLPELEAVPRWLLQRSANSLQSMRIGFCPKLTALPERLQNLSSLQYVELAHCPELKSLPEGMQRLTALRELIIFYCPMLSERCKPNTGQDWPKIAHVPEIYLDGIPINPRNN